MELFAEYPYVLDEKPCIVLEVSVAFLILR